MNTTTASTVTAKKAASPHVRNPLTDSGVLRILLADDQFNPPSASSLMIESQPESVVCPRCDGGLLASANVCPHCACYVGMLPNFMRDLSR